MRRDEEARNAVRLTAGATMFPNNGNGTHHGNRRTPYLPGRRPPSNIQTPTVLLHLAHGNPRALPAVHPSTHRSIGHKAMEVPLRSRIRRFVLPGLLPESRRLRFHNLEQELLAEVLQHIERSATTPFRQIRQMKAPCSPPTQDHPRTQYQIATPTHRRSSVLADRSISQSGRRWC